MLFRSARVEGLGGDGPPEYLPDLGHALLSMICWSSDGSISMEYEGDLHRGEWVGDRFEVGSMDDLREAKDFADWVDVSKKVVKILDKIWKSELGHDWFKRKPVVRKQK